MLSIHLILCPLLSPLIFSSIRIFSCELALHIRWSEYWSFSFSISLSREYSELISFRISWFDVLAVQGTLKSLLQHHRSKTSILWHSAFFVVQPSHPYMTIGKTIAFGKHSIGKITLLAKWFLCFLICCLGLYSFLSKEQASFNFMAAVTVWSHMATPCGTWILVPQLGIKPLHLALESPSLNHWTAREVPLFFSFKVPK